MSLSNFFRINLPYGLKRNSNNEWFCFNREYVPLGWNKKSDISIHKDDAFSEIPIYTLYKGLSESLLEKLSVNSKSISRGEDGKINMIFLYDDKTNPSDESEYWDVYFKKLKLLSGLSVNRDKKL